MADNGRIAVVGAGAVGSLVAAALLDNGISFCWVVRNPERRSELSELTLQFPDDSRSYSVEAVEFLRTAGEIAPGSRVIVAVKAQDIDTVIRELPLIAPSSVIAICNGLRSGPHGIGLLYGGGFISSGVLVTNSENRLIIGGLDADGGSWRWAVDALGCSFLSCEQEGSMRLLMWQKLAVNCVVNPLTAMLDCDNGDMLGKLHGPLVREIMRESLMVMDGALGGEQPVPTSAELLLSVKQVLQATRYNSSSMREDLRRGRPTEIGHINGAIVAEGVRLGLPCPVNELLVGMISLLSEAR